MPTPTTPIILLCSAALSGLPFTAPAPAAQPVGEIAEIAPEWVAVDVEEAAIRCGDRTRYYAVARVKQGTLLRLDGRVGEWGRVIYPRTAHPLVRADEVRDPGARAKGETIRLAQPSGLLAPDAARGIAESWKSIYATPIAAGTEFEVVETLLDADGGVAGYRVKAPRDKPARGFVKLSELRDATATEIAEMERLLHPTPDQPERLATEFTETAEGARDVLADASDATRDAASVAADRAEEAVAEAGEGVSDIDTSLLDPIVITDPADSADTATDSARSDAAPEVADARTPEISPPAEPAVADTVPNPVVHEAPVREDTIFSDDGVDWSLATRTDDAMPADHAAADPISDPLPRTSDSNGQPIVDPGASTDTSGRLAPVGGALATDVATLTELEGAFQDARQLPQQELDARVDELLEEYRRLAANLPDNAEGRYVGDRIAERVAWLELRQQTRDARRSLSAAIEEADSSSTQLTERIERLQIERGYQIVGRLTVSTVYDGKRLPRKLRVVSIGPLDAGRTIGYVREADEAKARPHLGRIVGIRGRTAYDRASNLAVVVIDRIEPTGD